jgi:hypothetical protein
MTALLAALILSAAPEAAPSPPPPPPPVPAQANPAGEFADADPKTYTFQLSSSTRFAPAVQVRLGNEFPASAIGVGSQTGGESYGWSWAPLQAIRKYSLAVTRRHFEDARWSQAAGKGKQLVVKSVQVVGSAGPSYQVQVVIDREEDGRRLGQATGSGYAQKDRPEERAGARWAGAWGGRAAYEEATKPRPEEDAQTIAQATLRALDHALLQLSAASYVYQAPGAAAKTPPPPPADTSGRVTSGKDPTQTVGATAAIKVVNGTSLALCDVRIWKDGPPGHTDKTYNFIRNDRIGGGQFKWLLDGIPSTRYHVVVNSCDGTEVMSKDIDLKAGDNALLVK